MTSQRFCLRWNNHQSNMLTVFDQLLHAETFTDVTLAVEGQYLKAHKMVLSACSPYFNALFVNHPEKHPIVILKDVPYADMKSLLDFMYRGEVSVDQERLTAFLRVAESLRIKGLTEVNDDKPLGPAITPPPPPQLHRIQPYLVQQRKPQNMLMNSSPLLGSALSSMPKRKRGRPRKLSGSSNGTGNDCDDYDRDNLIQGSPEMLEVKMGTDGYSANEGSDDNHRDSGDNDHEQESNMEMMDTSESLNKSQGKDTSVKENDHSTSDPNDSDSDDQNMVSSYMEPQLMLDEYDEPVEFKYDPNADSTTSQDLLTPQQNQPHINSQQLVQQLQQGPQGGGGGSDQKPMLNQKHPPTAAASKVSIAPDHINNSPELTQRLLGIKNDSSINQKSSTTPKIRINPAVQASASSNTGSPNALTNYKTSILQQQLQSDSLNNNKNSSNNDSSNNSNNNSKNSSNNNSSSSNTITLSPNLASPSLHKNTTESLSTTGSSIHPHFLMQISNITATPSPHDYYKEECGLHISAIKTNNESESDTGIIYKKEPLSPSANNNMHCPNTPRAVQRRRVRRKANSSLDEQAEHLTEMSVRGLDLFRYASIDQGVYHCTECAKENVQKTFKNKYSFQRHAFLYHEGKARKVFPCPVCAKEFSRPDKMKNHLKTTHECFLPKEMSYHNPLNYLISAATASELHQIMPSLERTSSSGGGGTDGVSSLLVTSLTKDEKTQLLTAADDILNNENLHRPPTIIEPSIQLKEAEEVK